MDEFDLIVTEPAQEQYYEEPIIMRHIVSSSEHTAAVIDSNGFYIDLVRVRYDTYDDEEVEKVVEYYTLKQSESLVLDDVSDAISMVKPRWDGVEWVEAATQKDIDAMKPPIDELKRQKLMEISTACSQTIYDGITINQSKYSLKEHDQIELMGQADAIKQGATYVPYHADGELCRMYTAEEFMQIAESAIGHIFYNRTLCNHYNVYVKRTTDYSELDAIYYGCDLPPDLQANMASILSAAQR